MYVGDYVLKINKLTSPKFKLKHNTNYIESDGITWIQPPPKLKTSVHNGYEWMKFLGGRRDVHNLIKNMTKIEQ
jgi:hypothetical protein